MPRLSLVVLSWTFLAIATARADSGPPPELVKKVGAIADAVLDHHIEPPTRQQMLLAGIKAAYEAAGVRVPPGLARRVSEAVTPEQLTALLAETWPRPGETKVGDKTSATIAVTPEEALLDGMLAAVPGGTMLIAPQDVKAQTQFAGNRYVGLQIAIALDKESSRPQIASAFEGGPADRAGLKAGDVFETIEGQNTKGMSMRQALDLLRGEEGSEVSVEIRRPKVDGLMSVRMTREALPRQTLTGASRQGSRDWDFRLAGPDPIGYLRVGSILASTPSELRKIAQRLEAEGMKALVLDLRTVGGTDLHSTVLLADSLLDGGTIGRTRSVGLDPGGTSGKGMLVEKTTTYQAEPDQILRGWPLVVLVDELTTGTAEWLVAALKDNGRAVVVGQPTQGGGIVTSMVPLGEGLGAIQLATAWLDRGDGRPLTRPGAYHRVFRQRPYPENLGESGGVNPDHVVTGSKFLEPEAVMRGDIYQPGQTPDLAKDKALARAIEVLRADLKKSR